MIISRGDFGRFTAFLCVSLASSFKTRAIADGTCSSLSTYHFKTHRLTYRSSWIELDSTLIRQLEISVLQNFPLWVPRVVEGGHGWIRYPNYWQLELAKIHRKAELLKAYITPDEHSVALATFGEAFESVGSEPLVDGQDADFLGISEPHRSSHCSPLFEQSLSSFGSPSSVENSDWGAKAPPPGHIDSFKMPLTSLPSSGFVPSPCENHIFFGSPEMGDEYQGLTHSHYSPALTQSPKSTLGVWDVPGFYKPPSTIHLTEPGLSRKDPIFISDFPVQSEPPTIIFGPPLPHSFTRWSSSISRTAPGITLRTHGYSHVPELNWNGGTMDINNPYCSLPTLPRIWAHGWVDTTKPSPHRHS